MQQTLTPSRCRLHFRGPDRFSPPHRVTGLYRDAALIPGVMVSMTCPSTKAVPCQRKWDSRSFGAFVTRDPTMNCRPASSSSRRFVADSIPASATITTSAMPCRAWNCLTIGVIVNVSALLPSKQSISSGNPTLVDQQPDQGLRIAERPAVGRGSE